MNTEKIPITRNHNGDSRTAPKDITFEEFHNANKDHIDDVKRVLSYLSSILFVNAIKHDHTKLKYEKEFYDNFKDTLINGTDFVSNTWYQKHIREERHHPLSYCHDDINLLDILETIVDCVCAGKTRSDEVRPIEFNEEILKKAIDNTVKLVDNITEVVDGEEDE